MFRRKSDGISLNKNDHFFTFHQRTGAAAAAKLPQFDQKASTTCIKATRWNHQTVVSLLIQCQQQFNSHQVAFDPILPAATAAAQLKRISFMTIKLDIIVDHGLDRAVQSPSQTDQGLLYSYMSDILINEKGLQMRWKSKTIYFQLQSPAIPLMLFCSWPEIPHTS